MGGLAGGGADMGNGISDAITKGGISDGSSFLELPGGVSVAFGPLRLLDGSVAAPGREGPGVYLEVLLEGGECGDGIVVRREFDSRGSIISITASPQLTPRSA